MTTCTWSNEETDDHVMGSGCETWDWYVTRIWFGDEMYHVVMDDPENLDRSKTFAFSRDRVRETVDRITTGDGGGVVTRIRDAFLTNDPDADAMDCVVQLIVYGELMFG